MPIAACCLLSVTAWLEGSHCDSQELCSIGAKASYVATRGSQHGWAAWWETLSILISEPTQSTHC
jgi:hypothetical protein